MHYVKVIGGGRTCSRRTSDLMRSVKQPYHKVRLNAAYREDIKLWIDFSKRFNVKALILGKFAEFKAVYTDGST